MQQIKLGMTVAYDWEYLKLSLPLAYKHADKICLALDQDRISWSGTPYPFNDSEFFQFVKEIDCESKIDIYQDNFHIGKLDPMSNEVRQRRLMADRLGEGGWHLQLDTDEYIPNFKEFCHYLRLFKTKRKTTVSLPLITLWKQTKDAVYYVKHDDFFTYDLCPIATNAPEYKHGRLCGWFTITKPFYVLHQSWARKPDEIRTKISNWGHSHDFDTDKYFELWNSVNENNYKSVANFHPFLPSIWPKLGNISCKNIAELIENHGDLSFPTPRQIEISWNNSIFRSRLAKAFKLLTTPMAWLVKNG